MGRSVAEDSIQSSPSQFRRHSLFARSWKKKMQKSTQQQQQQQQQVSNNLISSPPQQQQQQQRNRNRRHRNFCRRSRGSSSNSSSNNTFTTTAEVTKKTKKPKRSSDSYIVHGGGRMVLFQLRLLVLVSSLVSILMMMMMMMNVVLLGYRSSTVRVGRIGPRIHQLEETTQTQTQTGYYDNYFDDVCSRGGISKAEGHFAATDCRRLSKKVDRFLLSFPVVTAFQHQQRTYHRRSREPTTFGRSSKSTTLLRRRHRPPFHRPPYLTVIEGDEREYFTTVKQATTTMTPTLFGKLDTSSVDLRRSTDRHDEWNIVPSDVDVDNDSSHGGTHNDLVEKRCVGPRPILVQHTTNQIAVMDTLGFVRSRRPTCQSGYQSRLRRGPYLRRTILFASKRDDGVSVEGRSEKEPSIHYLRAEMRQLLKVRPSRNTAVDATVLLKKMMSTDTRVYENGRRGDQINAIDCTQVISAIGKSGHNQASQMALSVLNDMVNLYKKGNKYIRPDVFAYTSVINAYARRGDVDGASKVFKMQVDDFKQSNNLDAKPNIRTYNVMMDAWVKSGRADAVDAVEKLFLVVKKLYESGELEEGLDVVTYSTVIDCWSKSGRKESPAKSLQYLNDMEAMGIQPNIRTYNRVLDAHAKQGDVDGALKVFEMMSGGEVKPNLHSYSILMDAWAKSGRSDAPGEAMKLLMTIKDLHAAGEIDAPAVITFTTALDAHAKQGDVDGAMKVFEMMQGGEVKPNLQSYSILLDTWAKSGRAEAPAEAMNLLMTIKDLHAAGKIDAPSVITFTTAMDAHAKQGGVDGALKVFDMMQDEVKPDLQSYNILLDAWAESGRSDAPAQAMNLLMTIKDLHAAGKIDAPTIITYNSALDAHAKQGDVDGALKVLEMISSGEVKPNMRSYSILLDAWAESGRSEAPEQAEELLKKIETLHRSGDLDEPPDVQTFGALHKCWNLSGRKNKQAIERMSQLVKQINNAQK